MQPRTRGEFGAFMLRGGCSTFAGWTAGGALTSHMSQSSSRQPYIVAPAGWRLPQVSQLNEPRGVSNFA